MNALLLLAQVVPGEGIDPNAAASGMVEAITSGQWGLVLGFGIMLAVWGIRIFWKKLPKKLLPYIAVGIGGLIAFAAAMVADDSDWLGAVLAGIQAGLAAAGTWGLFGVVRKKKPK